jgi:tetratricopeptide (TPR) repeat protein
VDVTDYPQMFRRMIVRSAETALAGIDPQALKLQEEERERSLYVLSMALDVDEAWPAAGTLALTVSPHMTLQGHHKEWVDYLMLAATKAKQVGDEHALARLQVEIGWLHRSTSAYAAADEYLAEGYARARRLDDVEVQLVALERLAALAVECTDLPRARGYIEAALALLPLEDGRRAHSCARQGFIALQQGEWETAIRAYTESWRLHKETGMLHFAAQAQRGLAYTYTYVQRYDEAVAHYRQALQTLQQLDKPTDAAIAQMGLGITHWYRKEYAEALEMFRLCEPVFVKTGHQSSLANLYNNRGLVLRDLCEWEQARASFSLAMELMRALHLPFEVANIMENLGDLCLAMGQPDAAVVVWQEALAELTSLPEPPRHLYDSLRGRIRAVEGIRVHKK